MLKEVVQGQVKTQDHVRENLHLYLDPAVADYPLKSSVPPEVLRRYDAMVNGESLDVVEIADAFIEMMDQTESGVMLKPPEDQTVEQHVNEIFEELFDLDGKLTITDIFVKAGEEGSEDSGDAYGDGNRD